MIICSFHTFTSIPPTRDWSLSVAEYQLAACKKLLKLQSYVYVMLCVCACAVADPEFVREVSDSATPTYFWVCSMREREMGGGEGMEGTLPVWRPRIEREVPSSRAGCFSQHPKDACLTLNELRDMLHQQGPSPTTSATESLVTLYSRSDKI